MMILFTVLENLILIDEATITLCDIGRNWHLFKHSIWLLHRYRYHIWQRGQHFYFHYEQQVRH